MLSETTWRLRKALAEADGLVHGNRYVDMGVRVHVVRQDLEHGVETVAGTPPVVSVGTHEVGGMLDSRTLRIVGKSLKPRVWYASEAQARLLFGLGTAPKVLCYGGMGAGKTRTLAPYLLLRALELTGRCVELGGTAPTIERLGMLTEALAELMPADWYTYRAKERLFLLRNGTRIRLVATTPRSAALGSPCQGWTWAASVSDEVQDQIAANADIEARGRRAPGGIYRRFCTATAKDSPEWRTFRDHLRSTGNWSIERLDGPSNAFVWPAYWESLKQELDARTYQRLVLAMDVGPERSVYPAYSRDDSVRPVPELGARDVTRQRVGAAGLVGHDPGTLQDVSLLLKCYEIGGTDCWFVVDEITTSQTTTEDHVLTVQRRLQERWDLQWPGEDEPKVLVRCDPQGDSDNKTDRSVYTTWRLNGFEIKSAAYTPKGQPKGRVPKDAGIEMINRLFCSAAGKRRLFVACDEHRKPAAPRLIEALEMSERDELGKAETKIKGKTDFSHWPAALRYALWPYERMREGQGVQSAGALS